MKKVGLIAPSIAAADLGALRDEIRKIEAAGADLIHIDIMDGVFVPNLTFGPWILDVARSATSLPLDCHLMVSHPKDWIPILAAAGADSITIHIESTCHIHRLVEEIKNLGKKAGISLNPGNPISLLDEMLDWVDVVQVMSVDPGFSGQHFISNALEKIQKLHDVRGRRHFQIEVDGGINSTNITAVRDAGADIFVVGLFLFSQLDVKQVMTELKRKVAPYPSLRVSEHALTQPPSHCS